MNENFKPVSRAINDSWLQIKFKPGMFISIWLIWLIFSLVLRNAMTLAFNSFSGMSENLNLAADPEAINNLGFSLFPKLLSLFIGSMVIALYITAILGNVVKRFRNRGTFDFKAILLESLSCLSGLLATSLFLSLRFTPYILAMIFGLFLVVQAGASAFTSILFAVYILATLNFLFRYGLSHFVHLAESLGSRESIRKSLEYYKSMRSTISWLHTVCLILPIALSIVLPALFLLNGIMLFMSVLVYTNFVMNESEGTTGGRT